MIAKMTLDHHLFNIYSGTWRVTSPSGRETRPTRGLAAWLIATRTCPMGVYVHAYTLHNETLEEEIKICVQIRGKNE